jgi:hypothetical protein
MIAVGNRNPKTTTKSLLRRQLNLRVYIRAAEAWLPRSPSRSSQLPMSPLEDASAILPKAVLQARSPGYTGKSFWGSPSRA